MKALREVPPVNDILKSAELDPFRQALGEPFVMRRGPSGMRTQTLALCEAAGFTPTIDFEADDLPTVRGLVAADLGVAVVPAMGLPIPTTFARTRLLPLTDAGAQREVGVAWVARRPLLPSAESFRRFLLTGEVTANLG